MLYFHRTNRTKKASNWCALCLQENLFGGVDVVHRLGRLGRKAVRERVEYFENRIDADNRLADLAREYLAGGYTQVDYQLT